MGPGNWTPGKIQAGISAGPWSPSEQKLQDYWQLQARWQHTSCYCTPSHLPHVTWGPIPSLLCSRCSGMGPSRTLLDSPLVLQAGGPQTGRKIEGSYCIWAGITVSIKYVTVQAASDYRQCFTQHCFTSSPGLALPSHQVLNHCFRLWLAFLLHQWTTRYKHYSRLLKKVLVQNKYGGEKQFTPYYWLKETYLKEPSRFALWMKLNFASAQ